MKSRIPTVLVCVDDMKASIELYRDILGLPCIKTGNRWSEFDEGGIKLGLHIQDSGAGDKASRVVVLCIEVSSLADTCRKLRRQGYKVEGPEEYRGLGTLATTTDPDGVALSISQMRETD